MERANSLPLFISCPYCILRRNTEYRIYRLGALSLNSFSIISHFAYHVLLDYITSHSITCHSSHSAMFQLLHHTQSRLSLLLPAEEIVRRCIAGCKPEEALSSSNPIQLPPTGKTNTGPSVKLTAGAACIIASAFCSV